MWKDTMSTMAIISVATLICLVVGTPIGILMRLFGKDLLNIKFNKDKSYWIKREKNINTMKRQF